MKSHRAGDGERSLAVFIDFENMGLGFNNRRDRFEINKVLERLVEKGKIVAKKAYADWSRFGMYTGGLHEAAIELVEIPRRGMTGKNSADIRLVVDAIDLAYSQGPHRHVRDRLRRQRLLAARLEAEGTRQARHRPRAGRRDLGPAPRQLRRVHLLRRPRSRPDHPGRR